MFDRVSAEGAQGHRSWVQTQCRLRQSCSKFRLEGGHAERARRFCAREWPQLSRSLAARQLPSAGVDWADVCRTQMQRGRQLVKDWSGPIRLAHCIDVVRKSSEHAYGCAEIQAR